MAPPKNRRPGFSRRAQYGLFASYVAAGLGALVAVALLVISAVSPTTFAALRGGVNEVTAPVSRTIGAIGHGIASVPSAIGNHFQVMHDNAELRKQLAAEHRLIMRRAMLDYDNRRLKKLLGLRERTTDAVATARLVSSTPSSTRRYALLNAGWRQGVREGQPVRGPEGLIGRILESGPDTARVLLLADSESVVPVRRTRDGLPAIATGRGDGLLEVRPISLGDTVFNVGDVLVTSGTGGIYPPDVPVARVVSRTREAAVARPFERPDTLDFALVERAFFPLPPAHQDAP